MRKDWKAQALNSGPRTGLCLLHHVLHSAQAQGGRKAGRGYLAAKSPATNEPGAARAIFSGCSSGRLIAPAGSRQAAMETLAPPPGARSRPGPRCPPLSPGPGGCVLPPTRKEPCLGQSPSQHCHCTAVRPRGISAPLLEGKRGKGVHWRLRSTFESPLGQPLGVQDQECPRI